MEKITDGKKKALSEPGFGGIKLINEINSQYS
jgi:hypothetical protein